MQGCQLSGLSQLQGKVRRKLYTETCYSHLEAILKGILRMREVDKMLMDLRIAPWQSLMMGFQRLKLFQQILILRVRVMQSVCSVCKLWKSQIIG